MHIIQPTFRKRKISKSEIGFVLIAKPVWNDENYKRSVILIVEHTSERAIGIILNKQSNLSVNSALEEVKLDQPLYYGGPFNKNLIIFLHTNEPSVPDSIYMGNDMFIGGDYEFLKECIDNRKINPKAIRFTAGCVEWGPGQLEEELVQDKWWVSEVGPEYFKIPHDTLWGELLTRDGHVFGLFEDQEDFCSN